MTVKEVCQKFGITADTLRFYEKIGVIPAVNRTSSGKRDYTEEDLSWVENAICLRNSGVPIKMIAEYVKLFREGEQTISDRRKLLESAKASIAESIEKQQKTLKLLSYKIEKYKEAEKTGKLVW